MANLVEITVRANDDATSTISRITAGIRRDLQALRRDLDNLARETVVRIRAQVNDGDLRQLRVDLAEAARDVTARVRVEITPRDAVGELRRDLERIRDRTVNIRLRIAPANAVRTLRNDLARLGRGTTRITVRINITPQDVARQLRELRQELERLRQMGDLRIRITSGAGGGGDEEGHLTRLRDLLDGLRDRSLSTAAGFAALAARLALVGSAGLIAGASIARLVPVLLQTVEGALQVAPAFLAMGVAAAVVVTALKAIFAEGSAMQKVLQPIGDQFTKIGERASAAAAQGLEPLVKAFNKAVMPEVNHAFIQIGKSVNDVAAAFLRWAASAQGVATIKDIIHPIWQAFDNLEGPVVRLTTSFLEMLGRIMGISAEIGANGLAGLFNKLAAAMDKIDVGTIVAGMTRLGLVFSLLRTQTDAIKTGLAGFKEAFQSAAGPGLASGFTTLLTTLGSSIKVLLPVVGQLAGSFTAALLPALNMLLPIVTQVAATIGGALASALVTLTPTISTVAGAIGVIFTALSPLIPVVAQFVAAIAQLAVPLAAVATQLVAMLVPALTQLLPIVGTVAQLIGGVLLAAFSALLTAVQPLIPVIVELVNQFATQLVAALPMVSALLTVIATAFGQVLTALVPLLPQILQLAMTVGVTLLNALIALAPLIPQVATAFTTVLTAITPLMPQLITLAEQIGTLLVQAITALIPFLTTMIQGWTQLLTALLPIIPPMIELISLFIQILAAIMPVIAAVIEVAAALAGVFFTALSMAITNVVNAITTFVNFASTLAGPVVAAIGAVAGALGGIIGALGTVIELAGKAAAALSGIAGKVGGFVAGLFASGGAVGAGHHANGGPVRGAATGGPRGNLAWVGEQGRELVRLPTGARVFPHGTSEAIARRRGDRGGVVVNVGGVHVEINAAGADGVSLEQIVSDKVDEAFDEVADKILAGVGKR